MIDSVAAQIDAVAVQQYYLNLIKEDINQSEGKLCAVIM